MKQRTQELELIREICPQCGALFGLTDIHRRHLIETGTDFHCPNGHHISYGPGYVDFLNSQLARSTRRREELESELALIVQTFPSAKTLRQEARRRQTLGQPRLCLEGIEE